MRCNRWTKVLLLTTLILAVPELGSGQRILDTQYFFGNTTDNFVFDKNGRDVHLEDRQVAPFGMGGSAVISDQFNGNLLFYTDGVQVFDQSHQLVAGYSALNGDSSLNQPAVVVPNPSSRDLYYIFTNPSNGGANEIQFTEIDASIQGNSTDGRFPFGAMTSVNQSTGLTNPSEGIIIIEAGNNGNEYWLITQDRTTFDFRVTAINSTGIDSTQTFTVTSPAYPNVEVAHFAYNADSAWLAIAPKTANRNVAILDFDAATGELAFNQQILRTGVDDGQGESIYDVEWSNSGRKLYFSRFGSAGLDANVYQYDFDSLVLSPLFANPIFRSYGLKRGLDDHILHLYQDTPGSAYNLGRFTRADSLADSVVYENIVLEPDFQGRQFPAFAPPFFPGFNSVAFTQFDNCENLSTKFYPMVDPVPHNYFWDFGDGSGSRNPAPVHTYDAAGGYMVTLAVELNGRFSVATQFVEVLANMEEAMIGQDTTICIDEILTLPTPSGMDLPQGQIVWSTGETTETIEVDTTGTYWVEVTLPNGCTTFDAITVTEYGIQRQLSNQWYFGEMAGLDFNQNPPMALVDDNLMDSPEGCATISDSDGSLLFYTNGQTVWNKEHMIMVNGDSIGGDSTAAQSAMILPFPDDETLFYVFTTQEVYGELDNEMLVSIVDIKDDSARGSVVVKGIRLFDYNTERVTGSNFGTNGWLMTHEFGNNNFKANFLDETGITATVHSPAGEYLNFLDEQSATSYLRFQPGIMRAANMIPGANTVDILDFDNNRGVLSNARNINIDEPASTPLYGLEFSGGGDKMYVTTNGAVSKLIQYDLDSLDTDDEIADIEATKFDGYTQGSGYGAIQRGPNGVIYMAIDNATSVGAINSPSADDDLANFMENGVDLGGRISRLGLPNFVQNVSDPLQPPGFTVESACFGQPLTLMATGTSIIDEFEWTFDEFASPQSGVGDSIQVTYSTTGPHTIMLRIFNRCGYDSTFVQDIEVFATPENPTTPETVAFCGDEPEVILEAWPDEDPNLTYLWSITNGSGLTTNQTTRTISVTEPVAYTVTITNADGCSSEPRSGVVAGAITVNLGEDLFFCQDDDAPDLDSQNAVGNFNWTIDGDSTIASNTRFQEIDTSIPGVYSYALEYTEEVTGCVARDTVAITIFESPIIRATGTPPTTCDANDGAINFTIDSNGSFVYNLTGPVAIADQSFDGPGTPAPLTGLNAGIYTLNITNTVTGCITNEPVQVEDIARFDLEASAIPGCGAEGDIGLLVTGDAPTSANITVRDEDGMEIRSLNDVALPLPDLLDFDTGLYVIQIEEIGGLGCIQIDSVQLGEEFPRSNFTFDPIQELCGNRDQAEIRPGTNGITDYFWQNSDGQVIGIGTSVDIPLEGTYFITATGDQLCPRTEMIEININPLPLVEIEVTGDLCFGEVTLTAVIESTSSGPFAYQWLFGSDRTELGQTESINVSQEGLYQVRITDPAIGCDAISNPVDIDCQPFVRAPNAFSPGNNNDQNDEFFVFPNDFVDNFEIFIYSRWGEIVYYSDDFGFRWNGFFRGKLLPEGTYAYVIKFTSIEEPELGGIEQYGSVTLIR
ncbi:MAG: PKD domain-containing protein [Cytophagales bacterium]|nr:PKD domain-containing protein [Cytophagales bacterium]